MTERTERLRVVAEAVSWLGTPFIWHAQIKGPKGGADCGTFPAAVYRDAGIFDEPMHDLSPQWHLHADVDGSVKEEYLDRLAKHMREIKQLEVQPGDFIVTKIGLAYSHGAIVLDTYPRIIHCYGRGVRRSNALADSIWLGQLVRYFSPWGRS